MNFKKAFQIWQEADSLLQQTRFLDSISIFQKAYQLYPQHDWYALYIGDIYAYYLNNIEKALEWYEKPLIEGKNRLTTDTLSPLRYLLKRVAHQYYLKQEWEKAVCYYEWFISFQPSNFHDGEFIRYAEALRAMGKLDQAKDVLALGIKHSRSRQLRKAWNQYSTDPMDVPPMEPIRNGFLRIPVKTDIIMPGDSISDMVDLYTKKQRKKGDILTIASCVVAVAERRIYSVDSIYPSVLAKTLSKFVHDDQFPFGGNAPLCNPLSMQAAIQECGTFRILFSALIGGMISKLIPGSGMFYRMAGSQAALIDDMPGAIPPFDYYVVLGPKNSKTTCNEIKKATGHEAAVIDANDLQIAWAVACSDPKLKKPIEAAMQDNPAGNGDQQTPIILLRPAGNE